ncbi:hypothetical protein FYC62_10300 [Pedobacter aquae]|uniref:Preprotein translocase subunit SecB n=1 Tax=Pedobacter aquae TaxID=2605747 RepID=A0A5C0VGZ5_9SPHI|nr:protein-export chaperone SecB [Pedobacter aquae]QEK51998.1 hypothetical protein FYC62_10300 [Pedobacter aquae]
MSQTPFSFKDFHVADFSIQRSPQKAGKIHLEVEPKGYVNNNNKSFLLELDVLVTDEIDSFKIKANCLGFFKFKDLKEKNIIIEDYFYINAPAIMFPFIRSFISAVTSLSGMETINIPVINFAKFLKDKLKDNIKEVE